MARPQYQQRTAAATEGGRTGAERARQHADKLATPTDPIEALGYWDEVSRLAKARIGEMIDNARNEDPPIPWAEIGAALGVSPDAARQRWNYYLDAVQD